MIKNKNNSVADTYIFALGGIDEIGKNMYCIEHEDKIIIIDAGIKFPEKWNRSVDKIIPNYKYLLKKEKKILCLIITHGHEDHIGAIPYLIDKVSIPVIYAPFIANRLIRNKLDEKIKSSKKKEKEIRNIVEISDKTKIEKLAGIFTINFFSVNHSIPDSYGVIIHTPNGVIVHTGDYKIDRTPISGQKITDLKKIVSVKKKERIVLLMPDSTNSEVEGNVVSEKTIMENIENTFRETIGKIIFTSFASNFNRIQEVIYISKEFGRKTIIMGKSVKTIFNIMKKKMRLKIGKDDLVSFKNIHKFKDNQITIICTGSQGEEKAALMSLLNRHSGMIKSSDTVIVSSSAIPGNWLSMEELISKLAITGADIRVNSSRYPVHVSGHASVKEQEVLFKIADPKYVIPIHGEYRMLFKNKEIAKQIGINSDNVFILKNGQRIIMRNRTCKLDKKWSINSVPLYIPRVGEYGDHLNYKWVETERIIDERNNLALNGALFVFLDVKKSTDEKNILVNQLKMISAGVNIFFSHHSYALLQKKLFSFLKKSVIENDSKILYSFVRRRIKQFLLLETRVKFLPQIYMHFHWN